MTLDITRSTIEESEDRIEISASGSASAGSTAGEALGASLPSLGGSSMEPGVILPPVIDEEALGQGRGRKGKGGKGKGANGAGGREGGKGKGKKEPAPLLV